MPAKTFRDLIVWQEAYGLTLEIYRITKAFPKDELLWAHRPGSKIGYFGDFKYS